MNTQSTEITLKGFIVPNGYRLTIDKGDGESEVKYPGDLSGSRYSFFEVANGTVEGWRLDRDDSLVSPKVDFSVPTELYGIFDGIKEAGGAAYFVGGFVRDAYLKTESKDIDIEVYGLDQDSLSSVLSRYGKVDLVGVSFGVTKLTTQEGDYDFTMPRTESKSGEGHRGFDVAVDPNLSLEDAASRRDFTFNAMYMTPDGLMKDPYGGLRDLKEGVLRHVSEKFSEDPLRVLRGFQFAARFGLKVARPTAELAAALKSEYKTIAKERIWTEWSKWASKGEHPGIGLEYLRQTGWIDFYPELKQLSGIPQEEKWHPEGDVWTHTKFVCDAAAEIAKREALSEDERVVLLLAALCHDLGKPSTTQMLDGQWRAPGHDKAGVEPTVRFLQSIGTQESIIEQVVPLVAEHMSHLNETTARSIRRLANRVYPSNLRMLSLVMEADASGRPPLPKGMPEEAKRMLAMAEMVSVTHNKPAPILGGKDLMMLAKAGKIPELFGRGGPHFSTILNKAFEAQMDGEFLDSESGQNYLIRLLNEEGNASEYDKLVFLGGLSKKDKSAIADFANTHGLTEEDILRLSRDEIESIIKV